MAIGTPQSLGSNAGATGITVSLVAGANVITGDLVVVAISIFNDTTTVSGVTDGTNTYVVGNVISNPGNCRTELWYKENAVGLTLPTIVATFAGSATTPSISALRVTGILTSGSKDQSALGQGLAASFTAGPTGVLAQTTELAVGFSYNRGGTNQNVGTGFTGLIAYVDSSTSTLKLDYRLISSTAAVTYTGSLNSAGTNYSANLLTFVGSTQTTWSDTSVVSDVQASWTRRIEIVGY